jgi:hypothetical protein
MRARITGVAVAGGLALSAGLAVGGRADGQDGSGSPVRAEATATALRVDGRAIHGRTVQAVVDGRSSGGDAEQRAFQRVGLLKTRAVASTVREVQRLPSAGGHAGWAIRTFDRPRLTGGRAVDSRIDRSRPGIACVQVGRTRDDAFGWVRPGGSSFRPLAAETDLLALCATDVHSTGIASRGVLLPDRDPYDPAARVRSAVAWGIAPTAARRVRVTWAGWTRTVPVRDGTFLVVGPPPSGQFVDRDPRVVVDGAAPARSADPGPSRTPRTYFPGTSTDLRVAARVVDPRSGLPSAIVTGTVRGRPCDAGVLPIAAGVVGGVDPVVGTVSGAGHGCTVLPTLRRGAPPMITGYGGGNAPAERGAPDLTGRERLVPGGFEVTILTPPDVASVEVRSAGDVRTLLPVAPGVVHALYDGAANATGDFTGPGVDVTGIRDDGSRVRASGTGGPNGIELGDAELGGP